MPYTPTVWKAGDVVLPELLTKMEQGIAQRSALTVKVGEMSDLGGSSRTLLRASSSGSSSMSSYYVLQENTENIVSAFLAGRTVLAKFDENTSGSSFATKGINEYSKGYLEISILMDLTESLGLYLFAISFYGNYLRFYGVPGEYPTTKEPDSGGSGGSSAIEK